MLESTAQTMATHSNGSRLLIFYFRLDAIDSLRIDSAKQQTAQDNNVDFSFSFVLPSENISLHYFIPNIRIMETFLLCARARPYVLCLRKIFLYCLLLSKVCRVLR